MKNKLTTELVRELLHYSEETGIFTWRNRERHWFKSQRSFNIWNNRFAGAMAGSVGEDAGGYPTVRITLLGQPWLAHRLAFIWMNEALPDQVDHSNRNPLDNRWKNLAASSQEENMKNRSMSSNNTSGVTGVSWHKASGKWQARVKIDGKQKCLGCFTDLQEAAEVVYKFRSENGFSVGHGAKLAKFLDKA